MIDDTERIDTRIYAHGATGWSEDELADLVPFVDLPRHPVEGWRVDGGSRTRVQDESRDPARDRAARR